MRWIIISVIVISIWLRGIYLCKTIDGSNNFLVVTGGGEYNPGIASIKTGAGNITKCMKAVFAGNWQQCYNHAQPPEKPGDPVHIEPGSHVESHEHGGNPSPEHV